MVLMKCKSCGANLDPGERCDCMDSINNKQEFVATFAIALLAAREDICSVALLDENTVLIVYHNGYSTKVNITMDSYEQIMKDVLASIL